MAIGEALGVRATAIEYFEMVAPKEEVREAPTLLDLRNQASSQRSKLAVELDDLEARKSEYKDASRVWYRVTGALDHIQQLDAKKHQRTDPDVDLVCSRDVHCVAGARSR